MLGFTNFVPSSYSYAKIVSMKYILAVSGGVDSVVLADILVGHRERSARHSTCFEETGAVEAIQVN